MLRRLVLALLLISLVIRIILSWQPVEGLIWRAMADDAFYYLKLAQNLANGAGPTTDGINLTNGFHPLYALLLVPIARVAGQDLDLAVHLALTLISLVNVATAWPVYLVGLRLKSPRAGALGAVLYALNPWAVLLTMTGVESAVYVFLCAWAILAYLYWREAPRPGRAALAGLVCGLVIMARSEGALLVAGMAADAIWAGRALRGRRIAHLGLLLGTTAAVCLPWAVWSTAVFGTPLQTSSAAIRLHSWAAAPGNAAAFTTWYLRQAGWFATRYLAKLALFVLPVLLSLGVLAAMIRPFSRFRRAFHALRPLLFLTIPLGLLAVYYNLYLFHQQNWYFNASLLLLTVLAMPLLDAGLDAAAGLRWRGRLLQGGAAAVLALFLGVLAFMWGRGLYPPTQYGQLDSYRLGRWIDASGLRRATFASSDSGIVGYFCGCRMLNLDGVMNFSAYRYYQVHGYNERSLAAYTSTQPIDYVFRPGGSAARQTILVGDVSFAHVQDVPGTRLAVYRALQ